ncbi:hypothetical protein NEMBOFW57_004640 [Staphylotrichum longicolle]|uniref:Polyketide synthase-like phosphopantetheine-binding domain-containing protein n=1 Tax=Staphylotrichum longicolle TaxID=669026 RepID=A0AAD4F8C1_9PEZI|nr:hypothetical protein NEMBOFW57_004640 [Staphylotrichum longicolle]
MTSALFWNPLLISPQSLIVWKKSSPMIECSIVPEDPQPVPSRAGPPKVFTVPSGKLCMALKASLTKKTAGMRAGIDALARADTAATSVAVVEEILARRVAVAVMIPEGEIAVEEPLESCGVNSLVAVETKTWLAKELQTEISAGEISPSSISALATTVVSTSKLLRGKFKGKTKEVPV